MPPSCNLAPCKLPPFQVHSPPPPPPHPTFDPPACTSCCPAGSLQPCALLQCLASLIVICSRLCSCTAAGAPAGSQLRVSPGRPVRAAAPDVASLLCRRSDRPLQHLWRAYKPKWRDGPKGSDASDACRTALKQSLKRALCARVYHGVDSWQCRWFDRPLQQLWRRQHTKVARWTRGAQDAVQRLRGEAQARHPAHSTLEPLGA